MKLEIGLDQASKAFLGTRSAEMRESADDIAEELARSRETAALLAVALVLGLILVARALTRLNLSEGPRLP